MRSPLSLPPPDYHAAPAWSSPLPPTDKFRGTPSGKPKLTRPTKASSYDGTDPVPLSGVAEINGKGVYFLKIAMGDTGYSGFAQFVHETRFTQEEFKKMVDEAVAITNKVRVVQRREQMVKNKVPISNPVQTNEEFFATDVQFFEAVMCDKWDFRILVTSGMETALEPTVLGVK